MKFNNINFLKTSGICLALLLSTGCSDFLDEKDPSNIAPETFFTLSEHAEPVVNSIYENLRFFSGGAGIFSANFQLLDALSGTAKTETAQNSDLNNLYGFSYTGDNLHLSQWWRELYEGIANANLAIDKINNIPPPFNETEKAKWLGHAHFLRALHYFYLVRLWGDVPLITKPIYSTASPDMYPTRSSVAEVYELIVSDLQVAENAGLPVKDESGRGSLGAVKALLANVYLTMAGNPLNKGTEYYQKAADKAGEVIATGQFDLFANYNDLHSRANKNKTEHIFMVQYSVTANVDNGMQALFHPNIKDMSAYGTEIGTTVPTPSFYNSYEPGDKRTIDQQGYFYTSYYSGGNGAAYVLNNPYIFKHFDREANGFPGTGGSGRSDLNWPLIRYAEVLLTFAEAQNEVTGPTQPVLDALKKVRDRAGLATPTLGTVTKEELRELIWKERWHELCYEGITWFDMLRLRKVYDDANDTFVDFVGATLVNNNVTLQAKHLLLPLPAADFRNNPNLKTNNPGWE
jgi:starch-binding outer membrane protein, SusD/RagB family